MAIKGKILVPSFLLDALKLHSQWEIQAISVQIFLNQSTQFSKTGRRGLSLLTKHASFLKDVIGDGLEPNVYFVSS